MRQSKKKWVRRSPRVSPSTTAAKKRDPGCKNSRQQRNFFSREKHIHLVSMPLENIFAREAQKFKLLIGKVGSSKKKRKQQLHKGKVLVFVAHSFACERCFWAKPWGKLLRRRHSKLVGATVSLPKTAFHTTSQDGNVNFGRDKIVLNILILLV